MSEHLEVSPRVKKIKKLNQWLKLYPDSVTREEIQALSAQLSADQAYAERIAAAYPEADSFSWEPWQDLILLGRIGWFGGNFLSEFRREALKKQFPAFFLKRLVDQTKEETFLPDPQLCKELGVTAMHPVAEGGMFRTIYDMGKESKLGFVIHYDQVPIRQETIEICEFFDLDPWELYSGNCVLLAASHGQKVLDAFKQHGFSGIRVGQLTKSIDKEVWHHETPSGINRPKADALLQLFRKESGL